MLSANNTVKLVIRILEHTGDFTVTDGPNICCTGRVYVPDDPILELQHKLEEDDSDEVEDKEILNEILYTKDIYKELRVRGYDYGPKFQGLIEARGDGRRGENM